MAGVGGLRDASIVDIVWGAGFVLIAWVTFVVADGTDARHVLLAVMTTLWGGRLALYLWCGASGRGRPAHRPCAGTGATASG